MGGHTNPVSSLGKYVLCGLKSPERAWKTACAALWRIFPQIKVLRLQIGRKDSLQAVCRRMRRLEGCLYEAAKIFKIFLKIQNQN